jgi:hypothetical protein
MRPNAVPTQAHDEGADSCALGDLRFRALLAEADWYELPLPIRRRFSKRLADGETAVYVGEILETHLSRAGWLLAQLLRLIGAPLPTASDSGVPSVVTVTEEMATGGQIWTRLYARRRSFPQVVHSSKRFAGRTGLEEYVGYGVGMALKLEVEDGASQHFPPRWTPARRRKCPHRKESRAHSATRLSESDAISTECALVFRSEGYFFAAFKRRFFLPIWAAPGALSVTHAEIGDGRFLFILEIVHPRFGLLVRQSAAFRECQS